MDRTELTQTPDRNWLFPRRGERGNRLRAFTGALAGFVMSCASEERFDGVSYEDVRPIFTRRCITCHRPGGPSGVNIRDPYSTEPPPNIGIVGAPTQWKVRNPSLDIPDYDIKPGDPDNSFIMYKISDPSTSLLPADPDGPEGPELPPAGQHMPLQIPPLTDDEVFLLEDWVHAGAPDGEFMDRGDRLEPQVRTPQMRSFEGDVRPIFGDEQRLNAANGVCSPDLGTCARCVFCHYEGTPNPPNLSDPFGPDGIVNVVATWRTDMMRIAPGDPDGSLLIWKIRGGSALGDYGARMPYSYAPLSTTQVDLIRQWIADGARR